MSPSDPDYRPVRSALPWLGVSAVAIVLDQVTKLWITRTLELFETVTVLPVLQITRTHNTGAAWSFLADAGGWQRWAFSALAIVVSVVLVVWLRRIDAARQKVLPLGLTLILGGALGNVIDRLRLGHVVDFVAVHWDEHYFPAFNVADACITVGALLLIYDAFIDGRTERTARRS
jgi:signal peptidase II